jgi:hypothetical protein
VSVATTILLDRLSSLVALFGRGSLNGVAYDSTLGRPANDPLARLVGRGAGGYRFLIKAVRFALPDARLDIGALERTSLESGCRLAGRGRLEGTLRGTGEAFTAEVDLAFTFDDLGRISAIDAGLDPAQVARIQTARQTEASA